MARRSITMSLEDWTKLSNLWGKYRAYFEADYIEEDSGFVDDFKSGDVDAQENAEMQKTYKFIKRIDKRFDKMAGGND